MVFSKEYEDKLNSGHEAAVGALEMQANEQIAKHREQHAEELKQRSMELVAARTDVVLLKREVLGWRQKTVLYKMQLASAVESAQLAQAQLAVCQTVVEQLGHDKKTLLCSNCELQERVEALTELSQRLHRAKIAKQGKLESTDTIVKQLQSQCQSQYLISEHIAKQLSDEREAHNGTRARFQDLQQQLTKGQAQLQDQASTHAALQTDCAGLRIALEKERQTRAGLEAQVEKLNGDVRAQSAQLQAAEQRIMQAQQEGVQREQQQLQELQRRRTADGVIFQELQMDIERLKERLAQARRDAEEEQKVLQAKLERELGQREALERECMAKGQQLREQQDGHSIALAQLRGQLTEKVIELQQATDAAKRFEDRLAAMEKRAAARIEELEAALQRSTQKLSQHVTSKDDAMAALQQQLEQQRRRVEQKDAEMRAAQDAHARLVDQLQRRLAQHDAAARDNDAQVHQHLEAARRAQQELESARLQAGHAESRMQSRILELQAALAARDGQMKLLMEGQAAEASQHDQQLRQLQAAHAAETANLEARTHELEQQLNAMPSPAELARLARLQDALAARDKQVKLLTEGQAAEASQHDRRLQQLQAAHAAEITKLEGRIHELEQQLITMPSPAELHRNQVQSATTAVDKLMGNLFSSTTGLGAGAFGASDDDDDDRGPSAHHILGMSQGLTGMRMAQQPVAAPVPAAPPSSTGPEAAAAAAAAAGSGSAAAAAEGAARKPEANKRGAEPSSEGEERPAGQGRGRKAAKHVEDQGAAEAGPSNPVTGSPAPADDRLDAPTQVPQADGAPAARAGNRRRAAQAGQARAKAMATALADDSDTDSMTIDTPGFEVKGARTRRAAQRAAAQAAEAAAAVPVKETSSASLAASDDTDIAAPKPKAAPAGIKRGRAASGRGKDGKQATKDGQQQGGQQRAAEPAEPAAARFPAPQQPACLMPPPHQTAATARRAAAAAEKPAAEVDMDLEPQEIGFMASQPPTQLHVSQPLTQRQPPPLAAAPAAAGAAQPGPPAPGTNASQQTLPAVSQSSLFSQSFFRHEQSKRPLATLNTRLLDQAKNRGRIIPFTMIKEHKNAPPGLQKRGGDQKAAKRPLPQLPQRKAFVADPGIVRGDALPPDILMRTLQPQPKETKGA